MMAKTLTSNSPSLTIVPENNDVNAQSETEVQAAVRRIAEARKKEEEAQRIWRAGRPIGEGQRLVEISLKQQRVVNDFKVGVKQILTLQDGGSITLQPPRSYYVPTQGRASAQDLFLDITQRRCYT
jgi:hypothetical protein